MAEWTIAPGEHERKDFMVFWVKDGSTDIKKENLVLIGKGIEDMPIANSTETDESNDVLGNHNFKVRGYATSMEVSPQAVDGDDAYSMYIDELNEALPTGNALKSKYLCVKRYKTDGTGNMRAWTQDGIIELGDFASGLGDITAAHTVHFVGERTMGKVAPSTLAFTADSGSLAG